MKRFFEIHSDKKRPLLLGYSGGPDSKALLYALLKSGSYKIHLAHVDHGWRKESKEEANLIAEEAFCLNLPLHRISLSLPKGKELEAREARISFFRSLFQQIPFQALILAHQAEDVAETSLKRVFEGAHLPFLGGMQEKGMLHGMPVLRPILKISKKEIFAFLEAEQLSPFFDPTNKDPAYLRSRFREELFPFLRTNFGKEIESNLRILSERSYELQSYLEEKVKDVLIHTFAEGKALLCGGRARIETRFLLQVQGREMGLVWPRKVLESVLDWVLDPLVFRYAKLKGHWVAGGRGWVFLLKEKKPSGFLRGVIDSKLGG